MDRGSPPAKGHAWLLRADEWGTFFGAFFTDPVVREADPRLPEQIRAQTRKQVEQLILHVDIGQSLHRDRRSILRKGSVFLKVLLENVNMPLNKFQAVAVPLLTLIGFSLMPFGLLADQPDGVGATGSNPARIGLALRYGESFQNQDQRPPLLFTTPPMVIPRAYTAPSQPKRETPAWGWHPAYYHYCRGYPYTHGCRSYQRPYPHYGHGIR